MKKYILILFVCISSALISYEGFLQAKASYYYPTDKTTRAIFKDGALYGIENTFTGSEHIHPWISVSALLMKGRSIGLNSKTKLTMVPIGIGLKYMYNIQKHKIYIGAGVLPSYVHTHDFASLTHPKQSQWAVGGVFKGGVMLFLNSRIFLDIFMDYSILSFRFSGSESSVGRKAILDGLSAGGSLGIKF